MKSFLKLVGVVIMACTLGVMASPSLAQPGPGWQSGMGPGMMGGYGPGYGVGPGMMGGYGPGSGMGPGMMGGYGPGYGMGPGSIGWGDYGSLNLNADQKSKIAQIQKEVRTKQWALMGKMMDSRDTLQELYEADKPDSAAINKQYKEIEDLRRQMVESSIDARSRINSILTKEQREKSREWGRGYGSMMWGY